MYNSYKVAEQIKAIAKAKGIMIGILLQECDLSKNTLSTMQSREYLPRLETITKIADNLDCSVDYLIGRAKNPTSHKCPTVTTGDISVSHNNVVGDGKVGVTIHNGVDAGKQTALLLDIFNSLDLVNQSKLIVYADSLKNTRNE